MSRRWVVVLVAVIAACSASADTESSDPATGTTTSDGCADVVDADAERADDGSYTFSVTVSSPDTGWEKYADGWEVRSPDGSVIGTRVLTHPHVDEQPFTRSLTGVEIPDGVDEVTVAARDSVVGFCGETVTVPLP